MATYDSTDDTMAHIDRVRYLLSEAERNLRMRSIHHDRSKLVDPEKAIFDEFTPKLKDSTYGSEEYMQFLADMKPALDHHYAHNSHHPEHYPDGVHGMSLFDVLEMLIDWKAASERHGDGDIMRSIDINTSRFKLSPQLVDILRNTVREFGWAPARGAAILEDPS